MTLSAVVGVWALELPVARWVAWLDTYLKNPKKDGIAIMHDDR